MLNELAEGQRRFFELASASFGPPEQFIEMVSLSEEAEALTARFVDYVERLLQQSRQDAQTAASLFQARVLGATLVAMFVGVVIAIVLTRGISRPMRQVASMARRIADGDLSMEAIDLPHRDEVGEMAAAFNEMTAGLRNLIGQVARATTQLHERGQNLRLGTEEADRVTEQIAHTIEHVAQ